MKGEVSRASCSRSNSFVCCILGYRGLRKSIAPSTQMNILMRRNCPVPSLVRCVLHCHHSGGHEGVQEGGRFSIVGACKTPMRENNIHLFYYCCLADFYICLKRWIYCLLTASDSGRPFSLTTPLPVTERLT